MRRKIARSGSDKADTSHIQRSPNRPCRADNTVGAERWLQNAARKSTRPVRCLDVMLPHDDAPRSRGESLRLGGEADEQNWAKANERRAACRTPCGHQVTVQIMGPTRRKSAKGGTTLMPRLRGQLEPGP